MKTFTLIPTLTIALGASATSVDTSTASSNEITCDPDIGCTGGGGGGGGVTCDLECSSSLECAQNCPGTDGVWHCVKFGAISTTPNAVAVADATHGGQCIAF